MLILLVYFFFQAEDGIRDGHVTGVQTCALPISAGSVGIANNQTGIYPIESPGGWQLIGHTPVLLYDPKKEWPFLLKAGDTVKFKSVSKEEYYKIKSQIDNNTYDLVNLIK